MNRGTFAIVFPLTVAALGAIIAGDAIASGFHGESCRTPRPDAVRWEGANEWLILQAAIFVPYLVVLWGVAKILANRLAQIGGSVGLTRFILPLGILGFACFAFNGWQFALNCGQETGPSLMPNGLAKLLMPGFYGTIGLLSVLVVIGFLMGLRADRQRGSWSR